MSEQSDVKTPTRSRGGRQADVPEVRVKVEQRAQEDLVMDLRAEADLVLDLLVGIGTSC